MIGKEGCQGRRFDSDSFGEATGRLDLLERTTTWTDSFGETTNWIATTVQADAEMSNRVDNGR